MTKPAAVIFDWDGTIVDTMPLVHQSMNHIMQMHGRPALTLEQTYRQTAYDAVTNFKMLLGIDDVTDVVNAYRDYFRAHHLSFLSDKAGGYKGLLPGAFELMEHLHALKIPMAVLSNKHGEILRAEARHIGWEGYFAHIIGVGDTPVNKPDPGAALYCLDRMGQTADTNVWFIGDTAGDIKCALAAGLTAVLVTPHGYDGPPPTQRFDDLHTLRREIV